jgi:hypothetical protein
MAKNVVAMAMVLAVASAAGSLYDLQGIYDINGTQVNLSQCVPSVLRSFGGSLADTHI